MLGIGKPSIDYTLDMKAINNIRALGIDMINTAKSGHPGIVLGAAPIIYRLYQKHLVFDPKDSEYINRDRFVMSAGHGSALLYATLFMSGFDYTIDDLKSFRKFGSKTPGHPEITSPGVDASTGPLGQGFAMGVGMALGESHLNEKFKVSKSSLIDHYTYVFVSDGDLMEGISYEAAAVAGNYKLNKLIVLYDSNNITLDGNTSKTLGENVLDRFKSLNWDTHFLSNPYDLDAFDSLIEKAKKSNKPSIIEIRTTLGEFSKYKNTNIVHGKPLEKDDIKRVKRKLKIRDVEYTVISDAYDYMQNEINTRVEEEIFKWEKNKDKLIKKLPKDLRKDFDDLCTNKIGIDLKENIFKFDNDINYSGRDISNIIINKIKDKNILCLTTDTSMSTKVFFDNKNKNILCGVREFGASAIMNGLSLMNIRVITSTFLAFANYMIPSIRMAALMNLNNIYVFTHDTVLIGEDGPTHGPIEQIDQLRLIPNVTVFRPCDRNEMIGAYKYALNLNGPVVIIASKDILPALENTNINETLKGGYILKDNDSCDVTFIASGSEVYLTYKISEILEKNIISSKIVSMPSIELFDMEEDKEKILPKDTKKVVIELSSCTKYYKYLNTDDLVFNISTYMKSGNKKDIIDNLSYDEERIAKEIIKSFK